MTLALPSGSADRTRQILEDLEAVRENLLALSDDIWRSIDHNDREALESGVAFKRAFNDQVAAFDTGAGGLSALIQQYTSVTLESAEETGGRRPRPQRPDRRRPEPGGTPHARRGFHLQAAARLHPRRPGDDRHHHVAAAVRTAVRATAAARRPHLPRPAGEPGLRDEPGPSELRPRPVGAAERRPDRRRRLCRDEPVGERPEGDDPEVAEAVRPANGVAASLPPPGPRRRLRQYTVA